MLTVVGGIGYISGALIGGILYGTAFLVMGDFWAKLGSDWESLDWFFTFIHDFFLFLGPAVAGIGLGRNPNGIASQIFDGFKVLGTKRSRPILISAISLIMIIWVLRISSLIDGWTFLLLALPVLLISTLIAEQRTKAFEETKVKWELVGIEADISKEDELTLNRKIGISDSGSQSISNGRAR